MITSTDVTRSREDEKGVAESDSVDPGEASVTMTMTGEGRKFVFRIAL